MLQLTETQGTDPVCFPFSDAGLALTLANEKKA